MNRRGFLRSLGAVAAAPLIPLVRAIEPTMGAVGASYAWHLPDEVGASYARALARSMLETKETLSANILNHSFETANLQYVVRERYAFAHTHWRGIYGSSGA